MKIAILREISKTNAENIKKCGAKITAGYDADIALIAGEFKDFSKYKKLKWIHTSFVGVDHVLTDEIKKSNVILTNSRGMKTPVPEHALAMVLAFDRKLNKAFELQQKKTWQGLNVNQYGGKMWKKSDVSELGGKTVGILGLGAIGAETARLCKAFGCKVIGINKEPVKCEYVDEILPDGNLHALLRKSDYVIVCLPLTEETRHLIGKGEFNAMKKTAVIVNVGRGPVIDEKSLVEALQKKQIAGACLDVFENEPLPKTSSLWKMKNVIITCHYASCTPHYEDRMIEIFCKNLNAFKSNKQMINIVDKERGY